MAYGVSNVMFLPREASVESTALRSSAVWKALRKEERLRAIESALKAAA